MDGCEVVTTMMWI